MGLQHYSFVYGSFLELLCFTSNGSSCSSVFLRLKSIQSMVKMYSFLFFLGSAVLCIFISQRLTLRTLSSNIPGANQLIISVCITIEEKRKVRSLNEYVYLTFQWGSPANRLQSFFSCQRYESCRYSALSRKISLFRFGTHQNIACSFRRNQVVFSAVPRNDKAACKLADPKKLRSYMSLKLWKSLLGTLFD